MQRLLLLRRKKILHGTQPDEIGWEEIGVKEMLKKMYMTDFNEPCLKDANPVTKRLKGISQEDKMFLKIMQKEIWKYRKHPQFPLPLRNKNMSLPINQNTKETRITYLKTLFQKDFKFYEDYNIFTKEMISNGYAREAKTNPPDGRTWYLPYQCFYHPQKPSKLRLVFDCTTELNARSINKELLPGPDFANKLVGILTKFRENRVAFMADFYKNVLSNICC